MSVDKTKKCKPEASIVDELCCITGVDSIVAENLLEACNGDLEMAVNMHMENTNFDNDSEIAQRSNLMEELPMINEETVRAPIPQKREILVEPSDVQFGFGRKRRITRSVFDKFRNFEQEAKRQEEELLKELDEAGNSSSSSNANHSCGSNNMTEKEKKKMKTLEDLFRPPLDLIFRGTFQGARDAGIISKKWLMVNIQDSTEFGCQVLNRDVWSNSAVKTIVNEHFIFWQVYQDSEEGQRFMMFYKVSHWPYVAVLDPRTGECLGTWQKLDSLSFCDIITEFLSTHSTLSSSLSQSSSISDTKQCMQNKENVLELSEEDQIAAAIKASLEEDSISASKRNELNHRLSSESEELESEEEINDEEKQINHVNIINSATNNVQCIVKASNDDNEEQEVTWKKYLGSTSDVHSRLLLRYPDGSKDMINMPSSSKLMALVLYVSSKGYSNERYELVTNFPHRRISCLDFQITLKTAGLFPQETIFVQAR